MFQLRATGGEKSENLDIIMDSGTLGYRRFGWRPLAAKPLEAPPGTTKVVFENQCRRELS